MSDTQQTFNLLLCLAVPLLIWCLLVSGWFLPWCWARFGIHQKAKHRVSPQEVTRRNDAKRWLTHYLDDQEEHENRYTVNGTYNADVDRLGPVYGIDPEDEDAKQNFLSDLDQDEDEDQ